MSSQHIWRLAAIGAGCLLLVLGAAPAVATTKATVPLPPGSVGPFQVRNLYNGRCLDAPWGARNGTQVQLWDNYGSGQRNQQWSLVYNF